MAADALWRDQSEENWKRFSGALRRSSIRYYRIIFANGGRLNRMQDLTKSHIELYDSKHTIVTKVPLSLREGKRVRGATIYLSGLQVWNTAD